MTIKLPSNRGKTLNYHRSNHIRMTWIVMTETDWKNVKNLDSIFQPPSWQQPAKVMGLSSTVNHRMLNRKQISFY